MAEILDGAVLAELDVLHAHLASCDRCRDARHEADKARELLTDAGRDYSHPEALEAKVLEALGARTGGDESGRPARTLPGEPALGERAAGPTPSGVHANPTRRGSSGVWLRRPRNTMATGLVAAAATAAAVMLWPRTNDRPAEPTANPAAWSGKVAKVSRAAGGPGGLELCATQGCVAAGDGSEIRSGATLRTDDRTRAHVELSDGSPIALDRSSELVLEDGRRSARLKQGSMVADVVSIAGNKAQILLPRGRLEVIGTKFAIRVAPDMASVDVSRGSVELFGERDGSVTVHAGEEGREGLGSAPYVTSAVALADALTWSEGEGETVDVRGLGELKAKKPGMDEEKSGVVKLARHRAKVRIVDGFARTEIDETFSNSSDEVVEGVYRFPLPPDAQIERLALEVDGKLEEGAFVERDRAMAIWRGAIVNSGGRPKPREEIVWVPGPWKDPALLEWQRGGRFELRIFPIPKRGSRRVVLSYTQVVAPTAGVRRYVYPLAHDPSGVLTVGDFGVDVEARGHDRAVGVTAHGYASSQEARGEADALRFERQGFVPSGDLVIEHGAALGAHEMTAWAFAGSEPKPPVAAAAAARASERPTGQGVGEGTKTEAANDASGDYLAIALRPKLPRRSDDAHRAFALVIDASRSMLGERYRRAAELATRLVAELDPLDRFTVLVCDTTCQRMGELRPPSQSAAREVSDFLGGITPEGASDLAAAIAEAARIARGDEGFAARIVYLGDGSPTVGPVLPALLTAAVERSLPGGATVTAVAVGNDADLGTMSAIARAGNGVVLPYAPGRSTAEMPYSILGAALGTGLSDVELELPPGLSEIVPRQLDTIPAGGEAIVAARMTAARIHGTAVLRGKVGGAPFEQRYPIDVEAKGASGNAFVPRLFAAKRIGDLERDGSAAARKEAIALSSRFDVASRYTSLLVLESAAMFRAFGLDNTRSAPEWTGEQDTIASAADGETEAVAEGDQSNVPAARAASRFTHDDPAADAAGHRAKEGLGALGLGASEANATSAPMVPPANPPRTGDASAQSFGASPAPSTRAPGVAPREFEEGRSEFGTWDRSSRGPRQLVPMRVVWERTADVAVGLPASATTEAVRKAEGELAADENRRASLKKLFVLYSLAGDVDRAERLAERWSDKEPLDPEALTARADIAARRGMRELAIRILGSVLDVRADDVQAQRRLARLHRWSSEPRLACRYSLAAAQLKRGDGALLGEAVRCARAQGEGELARVLLDVAEKNVRDQAERAKNDEPSGVRGEVQLRATWQGDGDGDVDVALIHPDGLRISWLGAPSQEIISAEDVTARDREAFGVLGTKAGNYAIELVRARGEGPIRGELTVRAPGGIIKTIPFLLEGPRTIVGSLNVAWKRELVPAWDVRGR